MGQDIRLQNIAPPGVLVHDGHYGQNLEVLLEKTNKVRKFNQKK